jgi:hypothetical protein
MSSLSYSFLVLLVVVSVVFQLLFINGLASPHASGGTVDRQRIGYTLLTEFISDVQNKNWTGAASLLVPEGNYIFSPVNCLNNSKTDFLDVIKNSDIASIQVILGEWSEKLYGVTVIRAEVSIIFGSNAKTPYSTYNNPNVYIVVRLTPDLTKMFSLQIWADTGMRQANTTVMMDVWNNALSATKLGDLSWWRRMLSDNFHFQAYLPPGLLPIQGNNSFFLSLLEAQYANQASVSFSVRSSFVVCQYVAADYTVFTVNKDKTATARKVFMTTAMNPSLKIYEVRQWYLGTY